MTVYNVHLYREMRLLFLDIEAESPEEAAEACRELPDEAACGPAEPCQGEAFAALVDVQGDSDYVQSVTIDFEAERIRKAAPKLLATLEHFYNIMHDYESSRNKGYVQQAMQDAKAVIAEAKAAGTHDASTGIDIDATLAAREQIAAIWCVEDVLEIRPDLTKEQAMDVLRKAEKHHDATIGINWDVLHCHADWLFSAGPESDEAEGE